MLLSSLDDNSTEDSRKEPAEDLTKSGSTKSGMTACEVFGRSVDFTGSVVVGTLMSPVSELLANADTNIQLMINTFMLEQMVWLNLTTFCLLCLFVAFSVNFLLKFGQSMCLMTPY